MRGGKKRKTSTRDPSDKEPKKARVEDASASLVKAEAAPPPDTPSKTIINFSGAEPALPIAAYVNPAASELFADVKVPSDVKQSLP